MNIKIIRNKVDEISSDASRIRDEETIEDLNVVLDELEISLNELVEDMDDDSEYQEIMASIDEVRHIFTETIDELYNEDDEDDYDY